MTRALLAVGCNAYDHLKILGGAEADASRCFEQLLPASVGDYDVASSRLLLSPTLDQMRTALSEVLFGGPLDAFTLFFAGHGGVRSGSFYMGTRDTHVDKMSATAFALGDVFRMVADAAPKQTYIIIDACEAGGLIEDLGIILKADILGHAGSPSLTLLATAASNETAGEDEVGGFGTTALLECVCGNRFVQDSATTLDLVEIGRVVSTAMRESGRQSPVVWGLNLSGPPGFCRNPLAHTEEHSLRHLLKDWPAQISFEHVAAALPEFWKAYNALDDRFEANELRQILATALSPIEQPHGQVMLTQRIGDAFGLRGAQAQDIFREVEVRATCVCSLLPYSGNAVVEGGLAVAHAQLVQVVGDALDAAISAIDDDRFALLSSRGSLAELYQLPMRISRLLGWAGYAVHVSLSRPDRNAHMHCAHVQRLRRIVDRILEHYPLSVVAIGDTQAPYVATAISAMAASGIRDEAETLFGYLFASAVDCKGRVASAHIDPELILTYLIARDQDQLGANPRLVAMPTELVTVLIRCAALLDLDKEVDYALINLDHLCINAYLPSSFEHFGSARIEGGENATFQIGHGIWTVSDLEQNWPQMTAPSSQATLHTAIIASLLYPDRTPWFLLSPNSPSIKTP